MISQMTSLLPKISRHFNLDELSEICFNLGIDSEELAGEIKSKKIQSLLTFIDRRGDEEVLLKLLESIRPMVAWRVGPLDDQVNPYKGLTAFTVKDAAYFFGRKQAIGQLLKMVRKAPFTAILGASGSGKSSLVFAGLVAQVASENIWLTVSYRPGKEPFVSMASALLELLEGELSETSRLKELDNLASYLAEKAENLERVLFRILDKHPDKEYFLLIIDQFEELYTLTQEVDVRHKLIDSLLAMSEASSVRLVITMRADFLGQALTYPPLVAVLQGTDLKLGPMTTEELEEVIVEPARKVDLAFEPGLRDRILRDVENEPGHLPLLQFALTRLWDEQQTRQLTHAGYEEIGGVAGALVQYADETIESLDSADQEKARQVFTRLVRPGVGTEDTRRIATKSQLLTEWELTRRLADKRLVVTGWNELEEEIAEIAHEALIQKWSKLRQWLIDDREFLTWRERIEVGVTQWEESGHDDGVLLRGNVLTTAETWFKKQRSKLSLPEQNFIEASIQARNERRSAIQRQRLRWVWLTVFSLLIIGLFQVDWYGGQWRSLTGIDGGNVTAIAVNPQSPSTIYVAVQGKDESVLLKTNDNGNSWIRLDQGLHNIKINDILIDHNMPEILYLGTEGGGAFKSTDGGNTWSPINTGLRTFSVRKLVIHPANNTLYLATYGRSGGIYKSESDGLSWQFVSQDLPSPNINDLSINLNGVLFAATEDEGIYLSVNGGTNWESTALTTLNVKQVETDPLNSQVVYAGTRSRGVFKSSDEGMTWQPINANLPDEKQITAIAVSSHQPQTVYLTLDTRGGNQLYISHDQGNSWHSDIHPGAGANVNQLLKLVDELDVLYVATEAGLFSYGEVQGESQRISIDYDQINATDIAFSSDDSTIYVSVAGGVFHSQDDGESWSFSNAGLTHSTIRVLAPDPIDSSRIYAGTFSDRTPDAIFVSTDQGITWRPLTAPENALPDDDIRAIVINSQDTKTLYVGTFGSGVFKSINQGETWEPVNSGITKLEITDLKIDSSNSNTVYAIAAGGPIYKTTDGGKTWQAIPETTNKDIRDIIVDGSHICMAVYGQRQGNFQCSENSGLAWHDSNQGLASRFITQLEASAANPEHLYAGTTDQGVFLSRDNGQNWQAINTELANGEISSLLAEGNPEIIYSVVTSSGIFKFQEQYIWERYSN